MAVATVITHKANAARIIGFFHHFLGAFKTIRPYDWRLAFKPRSFLRLTSMSSAAFSIRATFDYDASLEPGSITLANDNIDAGLSGICTNYAHSGDSLME